MQCSIILWKVARVLAKWHSVELKESKNLNLECGLLFILVKYPDLPAPCSYVQFREIP